MTNRNSFWVKTLDQARQTSGWLKLDRTYKELSAKQIASDIRNAHKRTDTRIKGIQPGEQWDATAAGNDDGTWSILIRPKADA